MACGKSREQCVRCAEQMGGEGRHITMPDGRIVEYLVYGSKSPDSKVIVQIHGAGNSAGFYCKWSGPLLDELNVKGIAPSMPGVGYSDICPGRLIVDFPLNIEPILEAEGVAEFMVEGISLGTSHAMAVAQHFGPDRCIAMGLNVPYLGEQICREFKMQYDADMLPKADTGNWYAAWNFFVADLMWAAPLISPPARLFSTGAVYGAKKMVTERPWAQDAWIDDGRRAVSRGTQGMGWDQLSYSMNALWGFDPRDIKCRNIAIWYAKDDTLSPSSHGEWLANYFSSKDDINIDIGVEDQGYGHFTHAPSLGSLYRSEERTIPKTLLDLCAR